MTTGKSRRSVLVLGKSRLVLDQTVAALRNLGYTAQATNDFSDGITGRVDVTGVDLVVLGTQIPVGCQARLREEIGAVNPRAVIVESLAGIPGLIASRVQEHFAAGRSDPARAPVYAPGDRSIRLALEDPATVTVTVWWRTSIIPPDPKSDSLVLLDGRLPEGRHVIQVPGHVFLPPERSPDSPEVPLAVFATVRIATGRVDTTRADTGQADAEIYNFSITSGQ